MSTSSLSTLKRDSWTNQRSANTTAQPSKGPVHHSGARQRGESVFTLLRPLLRVYFTLSFSGLLMWLEQPERPLICIHDGTLVKS
jgi:hypothetical protein